MLRACVLDPRGSWEDYLPIVEFTYNNSYQATIGMTPHEALYERKYRSPLYWDEVVEKKILGQELVERTVEVIGKIRKMIKMAQDRQKSYGDKQCKEMESK